MADYAHKQTDKAIQSTARKLAREYKAAHAEVAEKYKRYLEGFVERDKAKQELVRAGKMTTQEWKQWRVGQMAVGDRWASLRDTLAADYAKANAVARQTIKDGLPNVYALNHNYAAYQIEQGARAVTSMTLYDRRTVERLAARNPKLLPDPTPGSKRATQIALNKDMRWNRQRMQSQLIQGILQGESIPKIAGRMAAVTGSNLSAATRTARTAFTGAQNAGRMDAYHEAQDMGIRMQKCWEATLDERTRESHAEMHGETVGIDDTFSNGLEYPADPSGDPSEVYNCRCTMIPQVEGHEITVASETADGFSFEKWQEQKEKQADAEAIAGVRRGAPMTHEEADSGAVNPLYGTDKGYSINCQSSCPTYEMRLRGYDVEVVSGTKEACRKLARETRLIWADKDGNLPAWTIERRPIQMGENLTATRWKKILDANIEEGARYHMGFAWKGSGRSGHIITLTRDAKNGLTIYDPQIDRTYTGKAFDAYLSRIKYSATSYGQRYNIVPEVLRVDDKAVNIEYATKIMRAKNG